MPRSRTPGQGQGSLLEVLEEATENPPLCPHAAGVRVETGGWSLLHDPTSRYHLMWVHRHPNCMRPRFFRQEPKCLG